MLIVRRARRPLEELPVHHATAGIAGRRRSAASALSADSAALGNESRPVAAYMRARGRHVGRIPDSRKRVGAEAPNRRIGMREQRPRGRARAPCRACRSSRVGPRLKPGRDDARFPVRQPGRGQIADPPPPNPPRPPPDPASRGCRARPPRPARSRPDRRPASASKALRRTAQGTRAVRGELREPPRGGSSAERHRGWMAAWTRTLMTLSPRRASAATARDESL